MVSPQVAGVNGVIHNWRLWGGSQWWQLLSPGTHSAFTVLLLLFGNDGKTITVTFFNTDINTSCSTDLSLDTAPLLPVAGARVCQHHHWLAH